ncbi:copper chaperone PCu(A)C [Microbispora hainanensis]|uniref:Copper chaperone PCu(A)C n=1 Tax=Microbispora hainanensis TaxID=568844 RepID=A0ABZ1SIM8_9ACTN|nr:MULTISPECIES: copper chaperone PCu(A)C [Microbispora]NJP29130.1 copper chaperone PCu(A)C [Microbispora sp. CL1-1]TQS06072.1 copper chaperone PCu(A)C [Microbispora sp. SCL1-1]
MTSSSRRRAIAVAALLAAAIPALAACGAGFDANTNAPYAPNEAGVLYDGDGPDKAYGKNGVMIPQAFILGPDSGQQLAEGGSAPLYLTLLNSTGTDDQLTSIVPEEQKATSVNVQSPIDLQPGVLVKTPGVTVDGLKTALRGGESIKLSLQFKNAGDISLTVPVIARSREYATLPPAPTATPTAPPATGSPVPSDAATPETTEGTSTGTPAENAG